MAVSMGDQAGSLCCLKAELSGLRARGPALAFALPMTESLSWGTGEGLGWGWRAKDPAGLNNRALLSSLPVLLFQPCFLSHCTLAHDTLPAKRFSQQALQGGETFGTVLLAVTH